MLHRYLPLILLGIIIAACAPNQPPIPAANEIIKVAFTPAAAHLSPYFNRCANSLDSFGIAAYEISASSLSLDNTDIAIRWGPPPLDSSQPYVLLEDKLILIVHAESTASSLTREEIAAIFTLDYTTKQVNDRLAEFVPYAYPHNSDIGQVFSGIIGIPEITNPNVKIVPDPAAMIQAVKEDTNAIGSIPRSLGSAGVKEIAIPDLADHEVSVTVLAMTENDPTFAQTQWIHCLQLSLVE